jgi:hypothetical protein
MNRFRWIRSKTTLSLAFAFRLFLMSCTVAQALDVEQPWLDATNRQCPSHHVTWLPGYARSNLVNAFNQTLSISLQARVDRVSDTVNRCEDTILGYECDLWTNLQAYAKLRLIERFAAFSCRNAKCEDLAICSREPPNFQ